MDDSLKILLVEDLDSDADLIIRYLEKESTGLTFLRVWTRKKFINSLNEYKPDVILSDCTLPQFSGIEAFRILRAQNNTIPFILISGAISERDLTQYLKEGVDEYILKDNLLRLPSAIENVINKKRLELNKREIEKLNSQLDATNKELVIVNKDIKDSINYAQKIQNATLPNIDLLREAFPGAFVSFKPKDVLSGDFFWFEKKGSQFFIAVADCTGHGIPGALLSMMGNNLLNEAVNIKKITRPSEILNRLNKRVRKILKHDKTFLRDGMDIVMCSIDLETNVVEYAGANRPLYIIRKGTFREVMPDKKAIGEMEDIEYTNHTIDLETSDRLFLFTDGFADQFHGKDNRKMTKKRLAALLTKSSKITIDMQEKIVNSFFDEWKGDKEQIDDVLLIGIEIPQPHYFLDEQELLTLNQTTRTIN